MRDDEVETVELTSVDYEEIPESFYNTRKQLAEKLLNTGIADVVVI